MHEVGKSGRVEGGNEYEDSAVRVGQGYDPNLRYLGFADSWNRILEEEYPLDGRNVAKALRVSPTTLYKYHFQEHIRAAANRQRENAKQASKKPSFRSPRERLQKLNEELKLAEERNKHLVARLALVEANAARLGIDPEELYRPVMKPVRTHSYAGTSAAQRTKW